MFFLTSYERKTLVLTKSDFFYTKIFTKIACLYVLDFPNMSSFNATATSSFLTIDCGSFG